MSREYLSSSNGSAYVCTPQREQWPNDQVAGGPRISSSALKAHGLRAKTECGQQRPPCEHALGGRVGVPAARICDGLPHSRCLRRSRSTTKRPTSGPVPPHCPHGLTLPALRVRRTYPLEVLGNRAHGRRCCGGSEGNTRACRFRVVHTQFSPMHSTDDVEKSAARCSFARTTPMLTCAASTPEGLHGVGGDKGLRGLSHGWAWRPRPARERSRCSRPAAEQRGRAERARHT